VLEAPSLGMSDTLGLRQIARLYGRSAPADSWTLRADRGCCPQTRTAPGMTPELDGHAVTPYGRNKNLVTEHGSGELL
jgi:hypothetical protein